ncbi:MAG: hypothetical protein GY718_01885 [Lentisphaerae bacterium]|nr:hypothetical protein [Lentisphaerota bacterium]
MSQHKPLNFTYQGITMNINKWATYAGMGRGALRNRVMGWKAKDVFKDTQIEGRRLSVGGIEEELNRKRLAKRMARRPNCLMCGEPVKNYTGNNQMYCKYTEDQKLEFGNHLSPCQVGAKLKVFRDWKNRLSMGKGPKNTDSVESYKAVRTAQRMGDIRTRKCIGILTAEDELGPHDFISSGPHHRICNKCHSASESRVVYDRPVKKILVGGI